MLKELGKKEDVFGIVRLSLVQCNPDRAPDKTPEIPEGHSVICGYNQGLGERLIVCETLEDMKQIWGMYAKGFAVAIAWYSGPDPGYLYTPAN